MLPEYWYYNVLGIRVDSTPFWVNKQYSKELEKLQSDLDQHLSPGKSRPGLDLGLKSIVPGDSFYFREEDFQSVVKSAGTFKSDRFFNPYSPDLGSGRNLIFNSGCWKGVGRNAAATRLDYRHASGILSYADALAEIFYDQVMAHYDPEINVPIWAGFTYDDQRSAFILRSSDSIRSSQIPGILDEEDRQKFVQYISQKLSSTDQESWLLVIMQRLANLLKRGVFHVSPTFDNVTIDGRILDHQSLDWISWPEDFPIFCEVFPSDSELLLKNEFSWREILNSKISPVGTPVNFLTSQFNAIRRAYEILKIPVIPWDDLYRILAKQTGYPEFLFKFGPQHYEVKINWLIEQFELAEKAGHRVYVYRKDTSFCISVGKTANFEIYQVMSKLVQVSLSGGPSIGPKDMAPILNVVLQNTLKQYLKI